MHREVLVGALAVVFGVTTVVLVVLSALLSWGLLFVAAPMGVTAYVMWYHASGRLARRMQARAARDASSRTRRTASTGPRGATPGPNGPRGASVGPRDRRGDPRDRVAPPESGMSRDRALGVLGLERGATEDEITTAYRRKVKQVHPDRGGDREAFKRVQDAYETLDD